MTPERIAAAKVHSAQGPPDCTLHHTGDKRVAVQCGGATRFLMPSRAAHFFQFAVTDYPDLLHDLEVLRARMAAWDKLVEWYESNEPADGEFSGLLDL